jgi:hypothetical protein
MILLDLHESHIYHRIMSKADHKYFLCTGQAVTADQLSHYPNSHIIGELTHVVDEGRKVTALARWDVSISTKDPLPETPEIDCHMIGDARNIRCRYPTRCENRERWEIGKAAFLQLMSRYGKPAGRDV